MKIVGCTVERIDQHRLRMAWAAGSSGISRAAVPEEDRGSWSCGLLAREAHVSLSMLERSLRAESLRLGTT